MNDKYNILWIMTDQQRLDYLGLTNNSVFTPNIDLLASEGIFYKGMFAQSPVCVPSRINFITGRYPHSHRTRQNNVGVGDEPHIFRCLKKYGYHTSLIGKNHMFDKRDLLGLNVDASYTNNLDLENPDASKYNQFIIDIQQRMNKTGPWAGPCWHSFPEEQTRTVRTSSVAIQELHSLSQSKQPFMMWVSFEDPHAPHTAPERFRSMYPESEQIVPENALGSKALQELENKPSRQNIKRCAQRMENATDQDIQRYLAVYKAMISFVDEQIGKLLDTLKSVNLDKQTIVIFTTDHGDFAGEHGMVKKDLTLYDCQLNIPFIMKIPNSSQKGKVENRLCEQIDVYPTLMELLGVPIPENVQGTSFLTGEPKKAVYAEICYPKQRFTYSNYEEFMVEWKKAQQTSLVSHPLKGTCTFNIPGDFIKSIRTEEWKYVWYASGEEELYHLTSDPGEKVNLSSSSEFNEQRYTLKIKLLEWLALSEDPSRVSSIESFCKEHPWP